MKENSKKTKKQNVTEKDDIKQIKEKYGKVVEDTKNEDKKVVKKQSKEKNKKSVENTEKKESESKKQEKVVALTEVKDEEKLNAIKQEIDNLKKKQKKGLSIVHSKIAINLIIIVAIILYFAFMYLGYLNINARTFIIDLRVFSIITIAITIFTIEMAYRKNNGKLAINGIEMMVISFITLFATFVYQRHNEMFVKLEIIVAIACLAYYIVKTMVIYIKERKVTKRHSLDIKKILKDETE